MKARGLIVASLLALAACSRSGSITGDVIAQKSTGEVARADRINVIAVPATKALEGEWADAIAAFQAELGPARDAQKAAASSAEQARLEWDRALAARNPSALRASRRGPPHRPSGRVQELWRQVRAADALLFQAKTRVWEIAVKHGGEAGALLERHKMQQVQTDESGHYVLTGMPAGKAYLYARTQLAGQRLNWFRVVQVRRGAQQADLSLPNAGDWPFVP